MHSTSRRRGLRTALVASAASLALALTGCSAGGSGSGSNSYYKGISIAFVSGPLSDSFFPPMYNGAKQAGKDLGVKVTWIPIDEGDIEKTSVTTMQTAIASKPSAIVVGDFVPSAVDPEIKQAVAAGIPVYVVQSGGDNWKADGANGFLGQDAIDAGSQSGAKLSANGAKSVLCVINVPGNPYLGKLCDGVTKGVTNAGGTTQILNLPTADSTDPTKVTADIGAFLKLHTEIDGIFTLNAAVGTYAIDAAKASAPGRKVHVGTLALSKIGLADIKAGTMDFLVSEQPYLDGYLGVLFGVQEAKFGLAPIGTVTTGPSFIDKSNIDAVLKIAAKYPGVLGSS